MRWMNWTFVLMAAWTTSVWGNEPESKPRGKLQEALEVRTYSVADLVVPLPPTQTKQPQFRALETYLRSLTAPTAWDETCSIRAHQATLSLVIRQTPAVHEKIAEALNTLRRELDAQAILQIYVITGPRHDIAQLAEAFPGEFGKFETEQLLQRVSESTRLKVLTSPKVTTFSRQTAQITVGNRSILANAVVAADRRSMVLKLVEGPENNPDLLASLQTVKLHSGRTAALRFEAPCAGGIIPPTDDAEERLLVATANVIVIEEEEEVLPKTVLMVTPRGPIIREEEDALLGIPTE